MDLILFDKDLVVPEWLRKHVVGVNIITVTRPRFPYIPFLVLSRDLEPELSGFVGYDNGLPFVSEDVPSDFRQYMIIHEVIEFEDLRGREGRCLEALKRELALVPDWFLVKYVPFRRAFFRRLIAYYRRPGKNPTEKFMAEITASSRYLESLA